jgi:hypothetical protein
VPLVGGARCLAFEMVGYGELGIDRAVYVGHDLGSGVAHSPNGRQHGNRRCKEGHQAAWTGSSISRPVLTEVYAGQELASIHHRRSA